MLVECSISILSIKKSVTFIKWNEKKIFFNKKSSNAERKKPSLNEIIDSDNLNTKDDNDFIDVLAAIEEEMTAVRELYVGGYISKGVYIAETDRLYEKAKIFGL